MNTLITNTGAYAHSTQHTCTQHTHTHLDSPNNFGIGNIANRTTDHLVKIINLAQLLVHKMLWLAISLKKTVSLKKSTGSEEVTA